MVSIYIAALNVLLHMKLRFDHQSIRLRVRKSDLEKLGRLGYIQETIQFPTGMLIYRLETNSEQDLAQVFMSQNTITVILPANQANAWVDSEDVGIYATLPTNQTDILLELIIEKDFPCKHGSAHDNADTFEELSKS